MRGFRGPACRRGSWAPGRRFGSSPGRAVPGGGGAPGGGTYPGGYMTYPGGGPAGMRVEVGTGEAPAGAPGAVRAWAASGAPPTADPPGGGGGSETREGGPAAALRSPGARIGLAVVAVTPEVSKAAGRVRRSRLIAAGPRGSAGLDGSPAGRRAPAAPLPPVWIPATSSAAPTQRPSRKVQPLPRRTQPEGIHSCPGRPSIQRPGLQARLSPSGAYVPGTKRYAGLGAGPAVSSGRSTGGPSVRQSRRRLQDPGTRYQPRSSRAHRPGTHVSPRGGTRQTPEAQANSRRGSSQAQ